MDKVERILREFPEIAVAYLFGSEARGTARPWSDVDIGLVLEKRGATALEHYWMLADVASRLESCWPGRSIDVVLLEPQGPIFCHRVLREGKRIYEADPDRRLDFETETVVRAFDARPTFELASRETFRSFRRWIQGRVEGRGR